MDYRSFAPGASNNNTTPPPVLLPEPPKHLPKLITWVVLLLAAGLTAYVGILYWQDQQINDEYVPVFTPRIDATANWKTYNFQGAFELKYPNNLNLVDSTKTLSKSSIYIGRATIKLDDASEFQILVLNPNVSFLPNDSHNDVTKYPGAKEMTISGVDAWQTEPGGNGYFLVTDIYKMPNVIEITYASANPLTDSDRAVYNQILSTFKFTK